jgi:hypothetical protein
MMSVLEGKADCRVARPHFRVDDRARDQPVADQAHNRIDHPADRHTSLLEVRSCPESGLDQHRLPLRTLLRTPFALPSHTPNTPGWYESGPCEDTGPVRAVFSP